MPPPTLGDKTLQPWKPCPPRTLALLGGVAGGHVQNGLSRLLGWWWGCECWGWSHMKAGRHGRLPVLERNVLVDLPGRFRRGPGKARSPLRQKLSGRQKSGALHHHFCQINRSSCQVRLNLLQPALSKQGTLRQWDSNLMWRSTGSDTIWCPLVVVCCLQKRESMWRPHM